MTLPTAFQILRQRKGNGKLLQDALGAINDLHTVEDTGIWPEAGSRIGSES